TVKDGRAEPDGLIRTFSRKLRAIFRIRSTTSPARPAWSWEPCSCSESWISQIRTSKSKRSADTNRRPSDPRRAKPLHPPVVWWVKRSLNPGSPSILILPRLIEDLQHPFQRRRFRQGTAEVLEARDGPKDDRIAAVFHDESTSLLDPMTLAKLDRNRGLAPPSALDDFPTALHSRIQPSPSRLSF